MVARKVKKIEKEPWYLYSFLPSRMTTTRYAEFFAFFQNLYKVKDQDLLDTLVIPFHVDYDISRGSGRIAYLDFVKPCGGLAFSRKPLNLSGKLGAFFSTYSPKKSSYLESVRIEDGQRIDVGLVEEVKKEFFSFKVGYDYALLKRPYEYIVARLEAIDKGSFILKASLSSHSFIIDTFDPYFFGRVSSETADTFNRACNFDFSSINIPYED